MIKKNCKLLFIMLFLSLFASLNSNSHVCACTCAPVGTTSEELQYADYVFLGKVTSITQLNVSSYSISFTVMNYWKGRRYETITIHEYNCQLSPSSSAFILGKDYIVYARGEYPDISINYCSRLITSDRIEDEIKELGLGQTPDLDVAVSKQQSNSFSILVLIFSFLIIVIIAIALLIAHHKRIRSQKTRI